MKVIQIAGFLGSGKTTTLISMSKAIGQKLNKKVAVIVNEIGNAPVDAKILEEYGLKVATVGGGCICCEVAVGLADTLVLLKKAVDPDLVLIEPTGVAVPDQVKDAILMSGSRISVEVGLAVVLLDPFIEDDMLAGEAEDNFIVRQIANADIIAVNKIDAVDETRIQQCENRAREINPNAKLVRISALRGDGMDELIELMVKGISS
jgi:G3E family GTPase